MSVSHPKIFLECCQACIIKLQAVSRLKHDTARVERRRLSGAFSLHRHCLGSAVVGPGLAAVDFGAGKSGGSGIQKLHMQRPTCTTGACFRHWSLDGAPGESKTPLRLAMLNVLPHDTGGRRAPHEARAFPSRVVQPVYVGRGVHGVFVLVQSMRMTSK